MGKLHALRKAIEESPESFIVNVQNVRKYDAPAVALGAWRWKKGEWKPSFSKSYKNFVKATLRRLGYNVQGG